LGIEVCGFSFHLAKEGNGLLLQLLRVADVAVDDTVEVESWASVTFGRQQNAVVKEQITEHRAQTANHKIQSANPKCLHLRAVTLRVRLVWFSHTCQRGQGFWVLGFGFWVLGFGLWVLAFCVLDFSV
jgi:hypothetical protein